ncbi:MAG: hypothetical protein ACXWI3_05680 [Croceibacterium sp.]
MATIPVVADLRHVTPPVHPDVSYAERRRSFLTQALPLLSTGDVGWDNRLAGYLRLEALAYADIQFGAYREFDDADAMERILLEEKYGRNWRNHPEAAVRVEALSAAMIAAERKREVGFLEPHWSAARSLAVTPAPSLAAALLKVELIDFEDLGRDGLMPRDAWEVVAEDMDRFAGE